MTAAALAAHNRRSAKVRQKLDRFQHLMNQATSWADVDAALRAGQKAFDAWRAADKLHPNPDRDSAAIIDAAARDAVIHVGARMFELFATESGVPAKELAAEFLKKLNRKLN